MHNMPLCILHGAPNSGKSQLAEELKQQYDYGAVHCVSPDLLGFSPSEQISESANMHKQIHAFV